MAVAALVCGIASLVFCPLTAIPGLITGVKARGAIARSEGLEGGDGLALAGIITSVVGLALVGVAVLAIVAVTLLGRPATSNFSVVGH